MKFIGIDGCKAGWFYVGFDDKNQWQIGVIKHIEQIASFIPASSLLLIDIPIGLMGNTPKQRRCDIEARFRLKPKRSASVFPVPSRVSLQADNYQQASNLNFQASGRKLSKQSWNIMNKIKQVDVFLLKTKERNKIREMHPELCFWALNHQKAMQHNKRILKGFSEREKLLVVYCEATREIVSKALSIYPRKDLARDDILDALVGAVTARFNENLITLPETPERDAKDLPMEVVFADMKEDRARLSKYSCFS
jgi:predicted RNase H-like nuclease